VEWLRDVLDANGVELARIDSELFLEACGVYTQFADKEWSFTDCTSYVLMRRLKIECALSFDEDFRQFGIVQVLP
jgi:hypothetical protein